jgi:predicted TIM-barrel fold metal-dependent hydrolase
MFSSERPVIVDVHVHLGFDYTFDEDFTRDELVEKIESWDVDVQIVQPGTCHDLQRVREQHDNIASLCREYPKKFYGMANPSPHLPADQYDDEIRRCVEKLGFVAMKLNTIAHGVNPNTKSGRKAFEAAQRHGIPLMVHTGAGVPFAGPVNLIGLAGEYPDVKIIMAHCGMMLLANEAAAVFNACDNVYGDSSWTPGFYIKNWLREYGHRFMLGTDHADNTGTELAKIRTVGLTSGEQESVLGRTAAGVFTLG